MKTITSYGGPFIVLNSMDVERWSGVFGKGIVGSSSPYGSDYEAACSLAGRLNLAFDDQGCLLHLSTAAFIIAPPIETAVILCNSDLIVIAQIESAENDWSFDRINMDIIRSISFTRSRHITMRQGKTKYIMFDSSVDGSSAEDYLTLDFSSGDYESADAIYNDRGMASINLYKFSKLG